jgi:hypothetical protein
MNEQSDRRASDPLLARALGPNEPELSCEECFAELDRYAELLLARGEADRQVPGMRAHLAGCPACDEDLKSLLALLEADGERR